MGAKILPTHTCFDDTVEIITHLGKENPRCLKEIKIIHAICTMPNGAPYVHAWVELGNEAMFVGIIKKKKAIVTVDKPQYRESLKVQEVTEYGVFEAAVMDVKYGYAPYKPEYRALTRKKGEKLRRF